MVKKLLDEEFEFKAREIDALLQKREEIKIERLSDTFNENKENENPEFRETAKSTSKVSIIKHNKKKTPDSSTAPRTHVDLSKKRRLSGRKKKELHNREDDLFEEIYGKFAENYADLVADHTQILLKLEKGRRKRDFAVLSVFGVSVGVFVMLLVPMFWI